MSDINQSDVEMLRRIALVNLLTAQINAAVSAMNAENQQRSTCGQSMAYNDADYGTSIENILKDTEFYDLGAVNYLNWQSVWRITE